MDLDEAVKRGVDEIVSPKKSSVKNSGWSDAGMCVLNAQKVCVNCGGPGSTRPGPCPQALEAGERATAGPGGHLLSLDSSSMAKQLSEIALEKSGEAEDIKKYGWRRKLNIFSSVDQRDHVRHAEAAVAHKDASRAHMIAAQDQLDSGKSGRATKARSHRDTAKAHDEAAQDHVTKSRNSLSQYVNKPQAILKAGKEGSEEHSSERHSTDFYNRGAWHGTDNSTQGEPMTRDQMVDFIVSNSTAWEHGDEDTLQGLGDDKLQVLVDATRQEARAIAVANSAATGFQDEQGNAFRVNPETGRWEKKISNNAKKKKMDPMNDGDDEENDDDEDDTVVENRHRVRNRRSDEVSRLSPELQERLRVAEEVETRQKMEVINKLVSNSDPRVKQVQVERLMLRTLGDLQADLDLMPKGPTQEELAQQVVNQTTRKQPRQTSDPDILGIPGSNWEEVNKGTGSVVNSEYGDDEGDIEEQVRNLPPRMQSLVRNAQALEARERRELIDQIVDNCQSDEEENSTRNALATKSIGDLKLMLRVANRKAPAKKINYMGAAGGAGPLNNRAVIDQEDMLLPPGMSTTK